MTEKTNLNTTGSFWLDAKGNYWSYNTQLTKNFNSYRLVNKTFYSYTTSRHQKSILSQSNDIIIHNGHFGEISPEEDLVLELKDLCYNLYKFKSARNSKYKQQRINNCQKQIELINKVLHSY